MNLIKVSDKNVKKDVELKGDIYKVAYLTN